MAKRCFDCDKRRKAMHARTQGLRRKATHQAAVQLAEEWDRYALRTRRQVSHLMVISVERVRQLEESAFAKIRKALAPFVD